MSVSRVKTWIAAEILTASDLNAEFNNILNNGLSLGFPATANVDLNGQVLIMDADADSSLTMDTDDQLDINLGGTDVVVIKTTSIDINGLELILDADADTSIHADTDDQIDFKIATADDFRMTANLFAALAGSQIQQVNGIMAIGATTTNANMTLGAMIDMAGSTNEIFALKSTGAVAHGITDVAETSTFLSVLKHNSATGGARIYGLTEDETGIAFNSVHTNDNTTKSGAGQASIVLRASKKSGTAAGLPGANANLVAVQAEGTSHWICDIEGDTWQDGDITAVGLTLTGAFLSLGIDDNATENAITISSDEEVTMPLQPCFLVTNASQQANIAEAGGAVTIVFGTEIADRGDNFATNTFTAPITGLYQLNLMVDVGQMDGASTTVEIQIVTTARTYSTTMDPSILGGDPSNFPWQISVLADMTATDTAIAAIDIVGGADQVDIETGTYFSGYLVA